MRQGRGEQQKQRNATEGTRQLKRLKERTAAYEECRGCSSLRVRGEKVTMENHGVDFNRWEERRGVRWKRKEGKRGKWETLLT